VIYKEGDKSRRKIASERANERLSIRFDFPSQQNTEKPMKMDVIAREQIIYGSLQGSNKNKGKCTENSERNLCL